MMWIRWRCVMTGVALLAAAMTACSQSGVNTPRESVKAVAFETKIPAKFKFVAYGDTRFHDPSDTVPSNPAVRRALVAAIARENPSFVSIGGDIVHLGESAEDWSVWDSETAIWRGNKIVVYPALGNHDVKGAREKALGNYFLRFPELKGSRYYSVKTDNTLMLILDSNEDELSGAQGEWLRGELDHLAANLDFVFLVFHHPVYTSSSDLKITGGGHSSRNSEQLLGDLLEEKQKRMRARFIVFNGHVHNYERHEHGGVTYFVTGGGGARAYPVPRNPDDPYQDTGINYHYLLVQVDGNHTTVTMNKLEFRDGKEVWTQPDRLSVIAPAAAIATAD